MHAAILNPKAQIMFDSKTLDFAWTTKEELTQRYLEDERLSDLCESMIAKPNYSPYTFYDEDYEDLDMDEQSTSN